MSHTSKIKQLVIPAFFLCGIIFSGCIGSKQIKTDNVLVKWQVEFKAGLSEEQKSKALQELDREIINYVYQANAMTDTLSPAPPETPGPKPIPVPKPIPMIDPCFNTDISHTPVPGSRNQTIITAGLDPCEKIKGTRVKVVKVSPAAMPPPIDGVVKIINMEIGQR